MYIYSNWLVKDLNRKYESKWVHCRNWRKDNVKLLKQSTVSVPIGFISEAVYDLVETSISSEARKVTTKQFKIVSMFLWCRTLKLCYQWVIGNYSTHMVEWSTPTSVGEHIKTPQSTVSAPIGFISEAVDDQVQTSAEKQEMLQQSSLSCLGVQRIKLLKERNLLILWYTGATSLMALRSRAGAWSVLFIIKRFWVYTQVELNLQ